MGSLILSAPTLSFLHLFKLFYGFRRVRAHSLSILWVCCWCRPLAKVTRTSFEFIGKNSSLIWILNSQSFKTILFRNLIKLSVKLNFTCSSYLLVTCQCSTKALIFELRASRKEQRLLAFALNCWVFEWVSLCYFSWRIHICFLCFINFAVIFNVLLFFFLDIKSKIIKFSNRSMELHFYFLCAISSTWEFPLFILNWIRTRTESSCEIVWSSCQSWCPVIDSRRFNSLGRHWSGGGFISWNQLLIHTSKRLVSVQRLSR